MLRFGLQLTRNIIVEATLYVNETVFNIIAREPDVIDNITT